MKHIILTLSLLSLSFGSQARTFLTPRAEADFNARYADTKAPSFPADATPEEMDALRFLYAYMPLNDLADHDPAFYLENIRSSMRTDRELPWCASVPDREWRHFVLPVRINNENLDMARPAFFNELRNRVRNLSMADAILEVNHWCHEKVTYRPSDGRTLSPLATVQSALGRCGEESTFTVAALRSVGIPARQVYTPRWAHTDDNHAWVEAWADGKWHFLGACEPEPVLDLGWFNDPAARGMLMSTKVFGRYDGPEEQLDNNAAYTVINVTSTYAPVSPVTVKVVDANGTPVQDAKVNFSLYNYAEFYPLATKRTDSNGYASLLTGHGDLVIWASDGNRFGITKANHNDSPATVTLQYGPDFTGTIDFDLTPPAPRNCTPKVSPEMAQLNNRRKAYEDSLRNAYTATFVNDAEARELAAKIGVDADRLSKVMVHSRGNRNTIVPFLLNASDKQKALLLLENITVKDMGDISAEVLEERMIIPRPDGMPDNQFGPYVLSPRISNEALTTFHSFLSPILKDAGVKTADELLAWTAANIALDSVWNPSSFATSPEGVWRLRKADTRSRNIFTVAAARTLGIPARINPVNGRLEVGIDQILASEQPSSLPASDSPKALFSANSSDNIPPKYYYHFSLSKVDNGLPQQQEYPEDADATYFSNPVAVEPGQYLLLTGRRMADGGVLAHGRFFVANPQSPVCEQITLRDDPSRLSVIGSFNSENLYNPLTFSPNSSSPGTANSNSVGKAASVGEPRSLLSTTGRGYYVLGIFAPGHEPSAHALNDLSARRDAIETFGPGKVIALMPGEKANSFDPSIFPSLPANLVLGTDPDNKLLAEIAENLRIDPDTLPIFIVADTFNRIVWFSQGYSIGLGDKLSDLFHTLQ